MPKRVAASARLRQMVLSPLGDGTVKAMKNSLSHMKNGTIQMDVPSVKGRAKRK
jgi:hypothetical protein